MRSVCVLRAASPRPQGRRRRPGGGGCRACPSAMHVCEEPQPRTEGGSGLMTPRGQGPGTCRWPPDAQKHGSLNVRGFELSRSWRFVTPRTGPAQAPAAGPSRAGPSCARRVSGGDRGLVPRTRNSLHLIGHNPVKTGTDTLELAVNTGADVRCQP